MQLHNRIGRGELFQKDATLSPTNDTSSAPTLTWRTRGLLPLHIHIIQLLISSIAPSSQPLLGIITQHNRLDPLEDIYVHGVHDAQQLIHVFGDIEAFITIHHTRLPMKLIVIDSIAALFRSQYERTPADLKHRCEMFFKISGTLKALANKFGVAVVVTNQVVDFIGPDHGINGVRLGNLECLHTPGRRVSPALGLALAHCINSRVFLARHEGSVGFNSRNAPLATISSQTHRTPCICPTFAPCIV
ncbi:DNA repair protein XRCC3 homolog [Prunus dulcis]|uniref:DNA repair protein XRCC3 homolog n=1 Tax=Prunus dulcis TaxID=3755 RepID=UPI001482078B|nr:DNA repair protein XRCC3 homolog [Prunus dulcis]